jgi:hypothetical protein
MELPVHAITESIRDRRMREGAADKAAIQRVQVPPRQLPVADA